MQLQLTEKETETINRARTLLMVEDFNIEDYEPVKEILQAHGFESRTGHKHWSDGFQWIVTHQSAPQLDATRLHRESRGISLKFEPEGFKPWLLGNGSTEYEAWIMASENFLFP